MIKDNLEPVDNNSNTAESGSEQLLIKTFLKRALFCGLVFMLILGTGLCYQDAVPALLNAQADKHELLKKAGSPKIVILGGSNASFGVNSQFLVDAFAMPVVNMGLYAEIGFRYAMKDIEPFIGKGDIIVAVPEYANFSTDFYFGSRGLIAVVFDVFPAGLKYLSMAQWRHLTPYLFNYAAVKVKRLPDYLKKKITGEKKKETIGVYSRYSFNEYGDAHIHWTMGPKPITPAAVAAAGSVKINRLMLEEFNGFEKRVEAAGASLLLLPPCMQKRSYENQFPVIAEIASAVARPSYQPSRYVFEENQCFDSPYHLTKEGVDIRSQRIVEDIRRFLKVRFE